MIMRLDIAPIAYGGIQPCPGAAGTECQSSCGLQAISSCESARTAGCSCVPDHEHRTRCKGASLMRELLARTSDLGSSCSCVFCSGGRACLCSACAGVSITSYRHCDWFGCFVPGFTSTCGASFVFPCSPFLLGRGHWVIEQLSEFRPRCGQPSCAARQWEHCSQVAALIAQWALECRGEMCSIST